jgi:hypothetical protein
MRVKSTVPSGRGRLLTGTSAPEWLLVIGTPWYLDILELI